MANFWLSWEQPTEDYRPLTFPPNENVLGWWCSGSGFGYWTLCAMVTAENEDHAKQMVQVDWPEAWTWRFCGESEDLALSDRFPLSEWMTPRFEAAKEKT